MDSTQYSVSQGQAAIHLVGQQPVATPKDVRKQLDSAIDAERDHVLMRIERNGGARFVAMKLA